MDNIFSILILIFLYLSFPNRKLSFRIAIIFFILASIVQGVTSGYLIDMFILAIYTFGFALMAFTCTNVFQSWRSTQKAADYSQLGFFKLTAHFDKSGFQILSLLIACYVASLIWLTIWNMRFVHIMAIFIVVDLVLYFSLKKNSKKFIAPFIAFLLADFTTQIVWLNIWKEGAFFSVSQLFSWPSVIIFALLLVTGIIFLLKKGSTAAIVFLLLVQYARFGIMLLHFYNSSSEQTFSLFTIIASQAYLSLWIVVLPTLLAVIGRKSMKSAHD